MKLKAYLIITFLLIFCQLNAQRIPNQTTPRNTLEEVFRAARTGNFETIYLLCDPEKRNDGDTKRICSIKESNIQDQAEFRRHFKLAYSLEEKYISEIAASVTFKFGPKAQQSESMRLVKRNNKWYLSGF